MGKEFNNHLSFGSIVVISSSMKYYDSIKSTISKMKYLGFKPSFPNLDYTPKGEILTKDEIQYLANEHYKAIDIADAIYFIMPNGYIGTSCKLELGYAIAKNKYIFFSELTNDMSIDIYANEIIGLDELSKLTKE